jgi:hypothetical protein
MFDFDNDKESTEILKSINESEKKTNNSNENNNL